MQADHFGRGAGGSVAKMAFHSIPDHCAEFFERFPLGNNGMPYRGGHIATIGIILSHLKINLAHGVPIPPTRVGVNTCSFLRMNRIALGGRDRRRAHCVGLIRSFQLLTLVGLLMQSLWAAASIPERLPKPPGSCGDFRRYSTTASPEFFRQVHCKKSHSAKIMFCKM